MALKYDKVFRIKESAEYTLRNSVTCMLDTHLGSIEETKHFIKSERILLCFSGGKAIYLSFAAVTKQSHEVL